MIKIWNFPNLKQGWWNFLCVNILSSGTGTEIPKIMTKFEIEKKASKFLPKTFPLTLEIYSVVLRDKTMNSDLLYTPITSSESYNYWWTPNQDIKN